MTPYWATSLAGGVLIGLAATALLWLNGRIAGISGITAGALFPKRGETAWRYAFLLGLIAAGALAPHWLPAAAPSRIGFPPALLIAGGLLVGFGTRLGGGCTSGHGVCGLGRLSLRSLVAVGVFMVTAILTTFIVRHVAGTA
ncbi:YeeE/YedE family protein [Stenotrophomonas rhizophila]